jgi:hypothetical protein
VLNNHPDPPPIAGFQAELQAQLCWNRGLAGEHSHSPLLCTGSLGSEVEEGGDFKMDLKYLQWGSFCTQGLHSLYVYHTKPGSGVGRVLKMGTVSRTRSWGVNYYMVSVCSCFLNPVSHVEAKEDHNFWWCVLWTDILLNGYNCLETWQRYHHRSRATLLSDIFMHWSLWLPGTFWDDLPWDGKSNGLLGAGSSCL